MMGGTSSVSSSKVSSSARLVPLSLSGVLNADWRAREAKPASSGLDPIPSPLASVSTRYRKRESHPSIELVASSTSLLSGECSAAPWGVTDPKRPVLFGSSPPPEPQAR